METPTPIWRTPEFWRELAKEWRGPETKETRKGICSQLSHTLKSATMCWAAEDLLYQFRPENRFLYFFPIGNEYRPHRAALCERIATHLEHEANQAQTSPAQGPTANQPLL